jgi:hypothetical protein
MLDKTKTKTKTDYTTIPYGADSEPAARLIITVDGIKPLLTHNPESMGVEIGPGKGSRIPEAEVEAEAGTYRDENGVCCLKGEAFRGSLLNAASSWKGKGRKSMKGAFSHLTVIEELAKLHRRDGSPITDYVIDARRATIGRASIIRRRPRFDEWSCTLTIEYDPKLIPDPKIIVDIMHDAGNRIGVGDYRPGRNGPFGRFAVREYAVAK